jgi:hypothetical protein
MRFCAVAFATTQELRNAAVMKLVLLALVAACSSATPPPGPAPEPTSNPPPPATNAPGIGQNCGPNDLCAPPAGCVSYYGIAGAKGPQFKTCEVKCDALGKTPCPEGKKCTTVADGPGSVCR